MCGFVVLLLGMVQGLARLLDTLGASTALLNSAQHKTRDGYYKCMSQALLPNQAWHRQRCRAILAATSVLLYRIQLFTPA